MEVIGHTAKTGYCEIKKEGVGRDINMCIRSIIRPTIRVKLKLIL